MLGMINNAITIAMAAVSVAEATKTAESTGASKFKVAMDIIQAELGLAAQIVPGLTPIFTTMINGIVLVNNAKGLFQHAPKTPAASSGPAPLPGTLVVAK
jgi:hypothetical protein